MSRPIPVPSDFAVRAPSMAMAELSRHYKRDPKTIRRWCELAGIGQLRRVKYKRQFSPEQSDAPEIIELCLKCRADDCKGHCAKLTSAKAKLRRKA